MVGSLVGPPVGHPWVGHRRVILTSAVVPFAHEPLAMGMEALNDSSASEGTTQAQERNGDRWWSHPSPHMG